MIAEIITIGDEILIGQTVDTNSAWIAQNLNLKGIRVDRIVSVSDGESEIMQALKESGQRADVIIMTGGLGPTNDDITKSTLLKYTNDELVFNQEVFDHISAYFKQRNREVGENNRAQALVPSRCEVLPNMNGTAPGMWFKHKNHIIVSIPGVPYEMKAIMRDEVLERLSGLAGENNIIHRHIITQGIPESTLMEKITDWENSFEKPLKLAYLPSAGIVKLRISAEVKNSPTAVKNAIDEKIKELQHIIPEYIVGYDSDTLEETVGKLLRNKGLTLATAESCTGGFIAHLITSISGSSDYFLGSIVSYSNELKMKALNVPEADLNRYGAVSEEVVTAMLIGVLNYTGAEVGIATSGIAGPTGGSSDKPVGTIWIAIGTKDKITTQKFLFSTERSANISRTARTALNMLRKELLMNFEN